MQRIITVVLALLLTVMPAGMAEQADGADHGLKGALGAELLEQSALPQNQPHLAMYVEYEKTDEYCTTHATATLLYVNGNGKGDNPAAKDLVIELKTEDTLELVEGSSAHVFFDELPCGGKYTFEFDLFCEFPMEQVEKAPEPKLTITAKSANVGFCEYTCTFDSMTEPRALVWGWDIDDSTPLAIKNDMGLMNELFGKSYYNMQLVELHSSYNHENILELLEQLSELETDHNDVTYLYVNAHGAGLDNGKRIAPGFFAFAPGNDVIIDDTEYKDKNVVLYKQIFTNLKQKLKGRIVCVFDICYSGIATVSAENTGFEEGQFSLLTAVDGDSKAGAYEYGVGGYGWFTKEVYDEFYGRTGKQTIGDVYSHMRHHADTHLGTIRNGTVDPQFIGNSDTVIFCSDPNAWIEDPEFVVVEETLISSPPVAVVITTELYTDSGEHFSARIVRPHVWAEANPDLTAIIDNELEALYAEKFAHLEERKSGAASCKSDMQTHTETLTLTAAYSNGGFVSFSLQNGYFMCNVGHDCNETFTYIFDVVSGEKLEFEDLLDLENNPEAEEAFVALIGEEIMKKGYSDSKAGKIYSEMLKDEVARWDITPQGIKILIDQMYFDLFGCGTMLFPYENLEGILKSEYLPQKTAGQMEVNFEAYDVEAIGEGQVVYENTPAASMLTLIGAADHVWVGNRRMEVDGSCSYFYAYAPGSSLVTLPYTNARVAWMDETGEHIEEVWVSE